MKEPDPHGIRTYAEPVSLAPNDLHQLASRVERECGEWVSRHVICLFGVYEGVPYPQGTAVLLRFGDTQIIASAAHALAMAKDSNLHALVATAESSNAGSLVKITGTMLTSTQDEIDIGFVHLDRATVSALGEHKQFLDASRLSLEAAPGLYYLHGFPSSSSLPDVEAAEVVATPLRFMTGIRATPADTPRHQVHLDAPISGNVSAGGTSVVLPHPDGLSGSGIWHIATSDELEHWSTDCIKLVGLTHAWLPSNEVIEGTLLEPLLGMIWENVSGSRADLRQRFPSLLDPSKAAGSAQTDPRTDEDR